jgi:hypothetical protein
VTEAEVREEIGKRKRGEMRKREERGEGERY